MPASNKAELLDVTHKEFAKLSALISSIDHQQAKAAIDGVSIKDVVGHRAHWIDLFLGWYQDGLAGKPVFFPAQGYKWNELTRYNADLRQAQSGLDWQDVRNLLAKNHNQLTVLIERLSDHDLYGGPMKGANNKWTPGRWAEAAGPSHFRSASKFIRSVLKASASGV